MKYSVFVIIILFLAACGGNTSDDHLETDEQKTSQVDFDTYNQKISYCIGLDHARGCYNAYTAKKVKEAFDIDQIRAGMIDYLSGAELRISFLSKDSLLNLYLLPNGEVNEQAVSKKDASYCVGMDEAFMLVSSLVGRNIDQTVDVEYMIIGVEEGMSNTDSPTIPYMDARREVQDYYSELNLENGEVFMEKMREVEGAIETESGLIYEVIKEGTGKQPNLTDSVTIHYTAMFIDGRAFESTVPSNRPFQGPLLNVIPGWQEGVMLMKEGGQRRLYIPPHLAYGEEGKGVVEPNATLVFDIELLDVKRYQ
ncbi:MAG: FKBP-type peptidyl-prolyl cis-trans isomerase [Crocinitomicaceae bacterium]|nr:FKBP-type peptidyl-prolyl cis-trans isomerase [Crocinitomicaceae bacterium]